MVNSHNCEFHTSRILTFGRLLTLALGLFLLCVNAMADVVINRYNGSDTPNYTGSDLYTVQTAEGAANGDVITISEDITPQVTGSIGDYQRYVVNLDNNSVSNFTLQSASASNQVTITGNYVGDGCFHLYNLSGNNASTINLKDLYIRDFKSCIFSESVSTNIIINADNVTFDNNQSDMYYGGAVSNHSQYDKSNFELHGYNENSIITFKNNTSSAVCSLGPAEFSIGRFFFTGNISDGEGGAFLSTDSTVFSNGQFYFNKNSAGIGGAIFCTFSVSFSDCKLDFINNSAGDGGALYVNDNLTFSGDDTVATFSGNVSTGYGDIYTDTLTFKDKGTYSFDGGIYAGETFIDQAQVTIAGRQFKPVINDGDPENVEDTTNKYGLDDTTISNGGKLSAHTDYINYIYGAFTICDAQSVFEQVSENQNQTATIKSSSGEGGTFEMEFQAAGFQAEGSVRSESVFISSGRVDIKGAMEAELEVEANATFSPGNSVGDMLLTGSFTLDPNATLLIEMDETGVDTLTASTFDLDGQIDFRVTSAIPSGTVYDILVATDENFTFGSDILDQVLNGKTLPSYMDLSVENNGKVVRLTIDHDNIPVPEPSTWALMILGAAGLLYWRKRK